MATVWRYAELAMLSWQLPPPHSTGHCHVAGRERSERSSVYLLLPQIIFFFFFTILTIWTHRHQK